MDIQRIARDYPELLTHVFLCSTGHLGEYLVAERLRALGHAVSITGNDAELDLRVGALGVEVKAKKTRSQWFVRRRPWRSDFWVFVYMPDITNPSFWVYTREEAQWLWDENPWNQNNPENGDIRYNQMQADALDAWHKLGA